MLTIRSVELKAMIYSLIAAPYPLRLKRPIWICCRAAGRWSRRRISTCPAILLLPILAFNFNLGREAHASDARAPAPTANEASPEASQEVIEVEKLKDQYWEQGNSAEIGVVQNRIYSKKKKIELGIFANNVSGDPFLSVYTLGGSLGYHFTEFFSTHLFAWNAFVSPSSALLTLQNDLKSTTNTNQPKFFYGAEFKGSFIYGKLSIIGEFIAYFDAYLTAGTGMIGTESGNNPALFFGLGQQIHVSKVFSLNVDYRYLV
jgi:outer membrane beta-barrel protein